MRRDRPIATNPGAEGHTGHRIWTFQRGILCAAELDRPRTNRAVARVPVEFRLIQHDDLPQLLATVARMDSITPDALRRRSPCG